MAESTAKQLSFASEPTEPKPPVQEGEVSSSPAGALAGEREIQRTTACPFPPRSNEEVSAGSQELEDWKAALRRAMPHRKVVQDNSTEGSISVDGLRDGDTGCVTCSRGEQPSAAEQGDEVAATRREEQRETRTIGQGTAENEQSNVPGVEEETSTDRSGVREAVT